MRMCQQTPPVSIQRATKKKILLKKDKIELRVQFAHLDDLIRSVEAETSLAALLTMDSTLMNGILIPNAPLFNNFGLQRTWSEFCRFYGVRPKRLKQDFSKTPLELHFQGIINQHAALFITDNTQILPAWSKNGVKKSILLNKDVSKLIFFNLELSNLYKLKTVSKRFKKFISSILPYREDHFCRICCRLFKPINGAMCKGHRSPPFTSSGEIQYRYDSFLCWSFPHECDGYNHACGS